MSKISLNEILDNAVRQKASDVHLSVNAPCVLRINGKLIFGHENIPSLGDMQQLADEILDDKLKERFHKNGDVDFAYSVPGLGRFRVNLFKQMGSIAAAIRIIPGQIPALSKLGLPEVINKFTHFEQGLLLVTGPTGSGKSTTLAAMIDVINSERSCHIITIEDPIEYLHRHKKSIIHQRELGQDAVGFGQALKAALRQDPDVILIGEMRDLETASNAITAAETGHLVLSTLHTAGAVGAIERIIDMFPPHQQNQIRVQLSNVISGVVAQRLLPNVKSDGRVAAVEILVATPAIKNMIREGKLHQIYSAMQTGAKFGMQTMEQSLIFLYQKNLIERETFERTIGEISL